jgi:hypothetical protein
VNQCKSCLKKEGARERDERLVKVLRQQKKSNTDKAEQKEVSISGRIDSLA